VIDLAQGPANVEITGAAAGDWSGSSLTSGDFNGDGHVDLAILSPGAAPLGGPRRGIVDLLWGPFADGTILNLASSPGTRIFGTLIPPDLFNRLSAGDLNGDGFADMIWGQPSGETFWGDGKVYVVLGRPVFPDTMDLALGVPGLITVTGGLATDHLGLSTCACDLDGDGYDELVASSPNPSDPYGELVVIHGSDSLHSVYDLTQSYGDVSHVFEVATLVVTGSDLACGDLDGDGRADLVVSCGGDVEQGLVRILFGHEAWEDTLAVSDPVFRSVTLLPPDSLTLFSTNVAPAPREGEVFVSHTSADPLGCLNCGEVYWTFPAAGLPDSLAVNSEVVARSILVGHGNGTRYGINLASGDFNADRWTDVAVVSYGATDETVIVYGRGSVPDSVFLGTDTTVTRILGRDAGGNLGRGIEVADFNGDGADDLALGAWFVPSRGRTYIIFGSSTSTAVLVSGFWARGGAEGVSLGWSVSSHAEVLGWHVDRLGGGGYVRLTREALPVAARSYHDASVRFDVDYTYHLVALTDDGEELVATAEASRPAPALALYQNVPNPFNPMTTIRFSLPRDARAVLSVYAVDGSEVARLIDEKRPSGLNEVRWDGRDVTGRALASGVYFYRLEASGRVLTRKLVLVR